MKRVLKKFLILSGIFVGSVILGYLLLTAVYCLPVGVIQKNIGKTADILANEGTSRQIIAGYEPSRQDNWTESCMLLIAGHELSESPFIESLENNQEADVFSGRAMYTLAAKYSEEGLSDDSVWSYGRYWHGYQIFLKPLLMVFNYVQIRVIIGALQVLLVAAIIAVLAYRHRTKLIIPVVITYIFLCPAVMSVSMQYDHVFSVTFLQILSVVVFEKFYRNRANWIYHFFIAGIVTAYFDLLTSPMVSFGVPLVFMLAATDESDFRFGKSLLTVIKSGISWLAGFGLFWFADILLVSLVSGKNYIREAIDQASSWSGTDNLEMADAGRFRIMWEALIKALGSVKIWAPLLALVLIAAIIIMRKNSKMVLKGVLFAICACLPVLWFAVLASHSYIHTHFALRNLSISVIAIMSFFAVAMESRAESAGRKIE